MAASYTYFPGCSLRGTGVAYEESLCELFRVLGIGLEELEDWNCCGATSYMAIDEGSAFALSARNLSIAHAKGVTELLAPCSACYLALRKAQDYIRHYPQIGARVTEMCGREGTATVGRVRVRHPLDLLWNDVGLERIKSLVKRKWRGGRIACYYGCQVVRPFEEVDKAHNPRRMDELMEAVGAATVQYGLKTKCCGGSLTGTIHDVGLRLNYVLLKEALRKGAECIVTICPLCQFNLDAYQAELRKQSGERIDLPILYFSQVLGWALGGDNKALALRRCISGAKLILRWFSANQEVEAYA